MRHTRRLALVAIGRIAMMAALLALMALTTTSCRQAHYLTTWRNTHTTDTLVQWRTRVDSVLVADSVALTQWQRGDTVYIEKTALRIRNRVIVQHDTLWRTRLTADTARITQLPPATIAKAERSKATLPKLALCLMALAIAAGIYYYRVKGLKG